MTRNRKRDTAGLSTTTPVFGGDPQSSIAERLECIERKLDRLTRWAERTAGFLLYSPLGEEAALEPLKGPFDPIDEAVRCRLILGRSLSTAEFAVVLQHATAECRTQSEVEAALMATPTTMAP